MFPNKVNVQGAPAVLGDFCDSNPRATVDAGAGAFVAGANGVSVGLFAWADSSNITVSNTGQGAPTGFVHRAQQGIITSYLAENTLAIPAGFPVTLFNEGGFWVLNSGTTTSAIGNTAYANYATGAVTFAASGTPPTSGSCTGGTVQKIVSASTGAAVPTTAPSCTASITGTVMTVTAIASGTVLGAGQTLSGGTSSTGYVDANTTILSYVAGSGTNGGIGQYNLSIANTVTSTTITASGGSMTLTGANTSGVFAVGQTLSVASSGTFTAGTTITGLVSATAGAAGTYLLNQPAATAVTAGTVTATNAMFFTADSSSTGSWQLNDLLVGSGIPTTGTLSYISATAAQNANLTGAGGAGTYLATGYYTAVTSETITVNIGVATKWVASSVGAPGELVKMTSWLNG
jgi:hypothetical protein